MIVIDISIKIELEIDLASFPKVLNEECSSRRDTSDSSDAEALEKDRKRLCVSSVVDELGEGRRLRFAKVLMKVHFEVLREEWLVVEVCSLI